MLAVAVMVAGFGPYAIAWCVHREAEALAQQVTSAQTLANEAVVLRTELSRLSSLATFLSERQRGPNAAEIVDALSGTLPDDAYLFRLDVRSQEVDLAGFSSDVPAMLKQLGQAPFSAAELTAPVMGRDLGGKSRFELRLRLAEHSQR